MASFSIINVVLSVGNVILGIFLLLGRGRLARDLAQSVERGEISKEDAEKKAELVQNCGLLLAGGGAIWLVILLLNR